MPTLGFEETAQIAMERPTP
jgi:hypothetical protein